MNTDGSMTGTSTVLNHIPPPRASTRPESPSSCISDHSPWMNDELRMYRASVRRFIAEELVPHQARWEQQRFPDAIAWKRAGETGLLLADVPEQYGGGGGTIAHEVVLAEELARAGVQFAFAIQSVVAHYILAYGNDLQKQIWLPRMARGELVGAIAMTEPVAGSDLQSIKTTALRDEMHYVIQGSKTFITNGRLASLVLVAAITNSAAGMRGISLIAVEPDNLSGYSVGRPLNKIGMHAIDACELFFDSIRVPVSNLLGSAENSGFPQMMSQLQYERLLVAAAAVATAERAVALTAQYATDRMIFGKPLLDLQNTRFKLAECKTEAHIGRVFLDKCIESAIAGELDAATAAMAKCWLTEMEGRVLDECLQLHGGYGYSTEYPIARMWADSRVHRIYAGTNEVMKELIAASL